MFLTKDEFNILNHCVNGYIGEETINPNIAMQKLIKMDLLRYIKDDTCRPYEIFEITQAGRLALHQAIIAAS